MEATAITPPALAKRYGVAPEKILAWIRAGELVAINIAARLGGRPRYVISANAVEAFELARSSQRPAKNIPKKIKMPSVIEFF
jgi:hypothetical protein